MSSTYAPQNVNMRPPMLVDDGFYADVRYDNSDPNNVYIGLNVLYNIPTYDPSWTIYKIFYLTGAFQRVGLAYGSWDGRASLF